VLPAEFERQSQEEQLKNEEKQRILGILPQFNVSSLSGTGRLTPPQKFGLASKSATDPGTFLFAGITAGISQAENSFPGYRQGAEGYAKRFGATYLDSFDGTMIGNAMLPIILHKIRVTSDKAKAVLQAGSGTLCFQHSAARVTAGIGSRTTRMSWAILLQAVFRIRIIGQASEDWWRPISARLWSLREAIGAVISEFWPDISHYFRKRHE
jgi:hypothetical protein